MRYSITPATQADLHRVARYMDDADRSEIWAFGHLNPFGAVDISAAASRETWAGKVDDKAVCVFGLSHAAALSFRAVPWLLGTHEVKDHSRPFLKASKQWIDAKMKEFTLLENFVDVRHTRAVRWLRWLGFTLAPPQPFGADQMPFHYFYMKA